MAGCEVGSVASPVSKRGIRIGFHLGGSIPKGVKGIKRAFYTNVVKYHSEETVALKKGNTSHVINGTSFFFRFDYIYIL